MRTCLSGNCTLNTTVVDTRSCGALPCGSGTYILDSINPHSAALLNGYKFAKFFNIKLVVHVGFVTDQNLVILRWESNQFVTIQAIPVVDGVAFDVFNWIL